MYNELNLLLFQIEDEIKRFGEETQILIYLNLYNGSYIDHCQEKDDNLR